MRIAITADLHLTTRKSHPDRFQALQDVLRQCAEQQVDELVIAGDLFDSSQRNFAEFEQAYAEAHPEGLPVRVIPGNHDPQLTSGALTGDGLEVLDETSLRRVNGDFQVVFVPYREHTSMGEHLPAFRNLLEPGGWALISHGDWTAGRRSSNPYETGTYMPLSRSDVEAFGPAAVLLGHIHAPTDDPPVHYPGSPCPLDINETGLRRFLIFDIETRTVTAQLVDCPRLYFNETVVMLPVEDEPAYLQAELRQRIKAWGVPKGWEDRVRVRLRIVGYSGDRAAIEAAARKALKAFAFYEGSPNLDDLNHAADLDRIHIARQVRQWIEELNWADRPGAGASEPSAEEIALEALRVIWGD